MSSTLTAAVFIWDYSQRQTAMDTLDDDCDTTAAAAPMQMALAFLSRFGPIPAYLAIVVLGSCPSGAHQRFRLCPPRMSHLGRPVNPGV